MSLHHLEMTLRDLDRRADLLRSQRHDASSVIADRDDLIGILAGLDVDSDEEVAW